MIESLRACAKQHSALKMEAMRGQGPDRHFFALRFMNKLNNNNTNNSSKSNDNNSQRKFAERSLANENTFFNSEAYKVFTNGVLLSTSTLNDPVIESLSFLPARREGFGVTYRTNEDSFRFTVSTDTDTKRQESVKRVRIFINSLRKAHDIVGQILDFALNPPKVKKKGKIIPKKEKNEEEELKKQFEIACANVKSQTSMSQENLILVYSLFKQSTVGDINKPKPGMFNVREKAKWEGWNKQKGKSKVQAMKDYISLAEKIC